MSKWNGSHWIREELRYAIYERDEFECVYCRTRDDLSLDHLRPRSKGGDNRPQNLVTACRPCNRSRGNRPWWKFADDSGQKRIRRNRRRSIRQRRARAKLILAASSWNDAIASAILAHKE